MPDIAAFATALVVAGDDHKALSRASDTAAVVIDLVGAEGSRSDVTDLLAEAALPRLVRVNDWSTPWTYRDVIEVVEGAGENVAALVLPRVQSSHDVVALDLLLTQIETTMELAAGGVGIVAQLDDARGVQAAATLVSPRLCGFVTTIEDFGQAVRLAAQAADVPAFTVVSDAYALDRAAADGFDGAWVQDAKLVTTAQEAFGR